MSTFQYGLMAVLAIFIIGGLLAGMDVSAPSYSYDSNDSDDGLVTVDIGRMGDLNSTTRTALQRDTVDIAYQSPTTTTALDPVTVTKGTFSDGETALRRFETQEPTAAYLSFTVTDAVTDGPLTIMLNGDKERELEPEEGQTYTIPLVNYTKGTNKLFFRTEKQGMAFWRDTEYTLDDISVTVTDEAVRKNTMTFRAYPYEVTGFDRGTVRYFVTDDVQATEPLTFEINGNKLANAQRQPAKRGLPYEFTFSSEATNLHPGENTLSVYTQPGSEYTLSNLQLQLQFFTSTQRNTVQKTFDIPVYRYRALTGGGIIRFNVKEVGVREPVTITLNDREYTLTPDAGTNTLEFSRDDISRGENTIRITTDGNYEIPTLTVDTR